MVRRGQVGLLLVVTSGLFSVLLAVAVNVATGGELPTPLRPFAWLAWPAVGLLAIVGTGLALWQQRIIDRASSTGTGDPASVGTGPRPAELPAAPALFGMDSDLQTVNGALADGARVVVLAAAPGTGKTSLALRAARDARAGYPDGQLYAHLRGASSDPVPPEEVLARFLGSLGRPEDERRGSVDELAGRFRSAVADRRLLILLDDARDAAQTSPLLPGGDGCLTIVTSRRLLADLPGAVVLPVGGLRPREALLLLAAAAGDERVTADPAGAQRIVAACAGLPLAVRLAGGRLRARSHWTVSALADRLDDEARRLDELRLGDRAVRSTFRTAYDELSERDRLVFRRAGAHPGQIFALGAAAARCGLDESTTAASLERLVEAFLVETPSPDRFRLHDLLRLFATERFEVQEPPDERLACLAREIDWLTGLIKDGGWTVEERDNVLADVRAAVDAGLAGAAWGLAEAVHPLLTAPDDHTYRLRLWQAAERAAVALGDDRRRVRALRWISHSYGMAGRLLRELPPAEEAVALAEAMGDPVQVAHSTQRLGVALRSQYRLADAEAALLRALDLFIELGDVAEEIEVRASLGTLYNNFWRPEASTPVLERALALLPAGESTTHGWVMLTLGVAYKLGGRREESRALTEQAFGIAGRLGDEYMLGYCHQERAWSAEEEERYDDAERDFRAMLAIFGRIGHGGGVGGAHEGLGTVAMKRGRPREALAEFDAGVAQLHRLHDRVREGELRLNRAVALRALGRRDDADRDEMLAEELIGDAPIHRGPAPEGRVSARRRWFPPITRS